MTRTRRLFLAVALLLIVAAVQNVAAQTKADINGWKEGDFSKTWTEYVWEFNAADFKKGENKISFIFGWGSHKLCIKDVKIIADGKQVASIPEQKTAGNNPKSADYTFSLTSSPQTLKLTATARTDGGNKSNGKININGILYLPLTTTEIRGQAYYGNKDIVKVVIPSTVTKIGGLAFHSCPNLKEIEIPSSVTTIGDATFQNCTALEKVTLPEGLSKLSYRLFKGCTNLKEIYIPASVTEFATEIFSECKNLTAIKVDRYTEAHAFFSADERIVLTNSRAKQTKEQWIATAKNSILDDGILYVGHGVTKINDGQYKNKDIKEIVFSDTVERIGNGAFQNNKELKKVVIPGNVKTIADGAFAGLNLEEVICEEGVEKIQVYAFYGCPKLNSVTLPKSATTIIPDGLYWENKDSRVFHCYAGSLAYNLAVKNGYKKIDIIGVDEQNAASINLTYLCLSGNETVKAGLFRDVPIEKIDLGNDITEIGKNAFNDKTILRVKRNTYSDKWCKANGYYLCEVLADLNFYTKDRFKRIDEDFTRILCDDDSYLNWTSYQFKVQEPLKIEEVDGNIVLTSFMLEPCENVTITRNGKTLMRDKTIQPLTRTGLCKADDSVKTEDFKVSSDNALYKKLISLGNVIDWTVSFNGSVFRKSNSGTETNPLLPMYPVHCREWIATICNYAFVIASKDYEDLCYEGVENNWFVTNQWQTDFFSKQNMYYLLQKTRKHTFLLGHCGGGGLGALNGENLWLVSDWFRNLGKAEPHGFFHEFSHNMGWNHEDGNMCNLGASNGYGEKCWPMMGAKTYNKLFDESKLPYTDLKLFNSDLFSYNELHTPDPAENVIKDEVLYIAEGVSGIGLGEFENNTRFTKVVFPSSVEVIGNDAFRQSHLSELEIPPTVKKIGSGAFIRTYLDTDVIIPDGLQEIGQGAFLSTRIPKIVVPASVTKFGADITENSVIWVVERGTAAYDYAVNSNYRFEIPNETPEEAAAYILKEKALPGPKDSWKKDDFPINDVRWYCDFSSSLNGAGKYVVTFKNTGYYKVWFQDALFMADGKVLAYYPQRSTTLNTIYSVNVPDGTKKLELYVLAHSNKGTDSSGTITVDKR